MDKKIAIKAHEAIDPTGDGAIAATAHNALDQAFGTIDECLFGESPTSFLLGLKPLQTQQPEFEIKSIA